MEVRARRWRSGLATAGLAVFLTIITIPALAADWVTMFENPTLWPANLRALTFPNGSVLDAQHTLTFGSWTVTFDDPPTVGRTSNQAQFPDGLHVRGLTCSNPVSGEHECGLDLLVGPPRYRRNVSCYLGPWGRDLGNPSPVSQAPTTKIGCPIDLRTE